MTAVLLPGHLEQLPDGRRPEAAGWIAATLLHYAPANPVSAPFWATQGYRPLWTA